MEITSSTVEWEAGSSAAPGAVGSQAAPVGPPGRGGGMGTRLG